MITNEEIELKFKAIDDIFFVQVDGDGYQYQITVVSDIFLNKPKVARQQWVYAQLREWITKGELHAISMKTWTKEEWGANNG